MKEIYYFEKKDGKFFWSFPKLPDWLYKITEAKKNRSLDQNRLYWGYILKFIVQQYKDFWYIHTTEQLHTIFKRAFIPKKREYSDFNKRKFVQKLWSTADLNTKQFSDYIKMIQSIFEFWHMDKLGLEKIDNFIIPDINEDELLYWESIII